MVLHACPKMDLHTHNHATLESGAGLTNILWMRPGRAVVQMVPYGWEKEDGSVSNTLLYEQLARNVNCTHFLWQNYRPENGFFIKGVVLQPSSVSRIIISPQAIQGLV